MREHDAEFAATTIALPTAAAALALAAAAAAAQPFAGTAVAVAAITPPATASATPSRVREAQSRSLLRGCRAQGPGRAARGTRAYSTTRTPVPVLYAHVLYACFLRPCLNRRPNRTPHPRGRIQVRCCSEVKLSVEWGYRRTGCSVWGESDAGWPCTRGKTFAEAEAICQAAGARLCTADELEGGCTAGTGCQFDFELIWGA